MKDLIKYLRHYIKESILAPLFKMLEASFELFVPLVMAAIIDTGIKNSDKPYIFKMGMVLVGLAIVGFISALTAQYFAAKAAVGPLPSHQHAVLFRDRQNRNINAYHPFDGGCKSNANSGQPFSAAFPAFTVHRYRRSRHGLHG